MYERSALTATARADRRRERWARLSALVTAGRLPDLAALSSVGALAQDVTPDATHACQRPSAAHNRP